VAAREGHVSGGSKLGKKRYQNSIKHRKTFSYQDGCDVVGSEVDGDMTRSVEVGRRSSFLVFRGHQGSSVGFLAFDQHLKRHMIRWIGVFWSICCTGWGCVTNGWLG